MKLSFSDRFQFREPTLRELPVCFASHRQFQEILMSKASPHLPRRRFLKKSLWRRPPRRLWLRPSSRLRPWVAVEWLLRANESLWAVSELAIAAPMIWAVFWNSRMCSSCRRLRRERSSRRQAVKKIADDQYGNQDCSMHKDFREVLDRKGH
jgi:hypothetical protein